MIAARLSFANSIGSRLHPRNAFIDASVYAVCAFSEVSGIFQLFTSHHHLLILAPTDCPFSVDDLFMCLHPETIRVHAIPCTRGIKICISLVSIPQSYFIQIEWKTNLIPHRDIRHNLPILRILNARKIALLEAQVRKWWHLRLTRRWAQDR